MTENFVPVPLLEKLEPKREVSVIFTDRKFVVAENETERIVRRIK